MDGSRWLVVGWYQSYEAWVWSVTKTNKGLSTNHLFIVWTAYRQESPVLSRGHGISIFSGSEVPRVSSRSCKLWHCMVPHESWYHYEPLLPITKQQPSTIITKHQLIVINSGSNQLIRYWVPPTDIINLWTTFTYHQVAVPRYHPKVHLLGRVPLPE